MAVAREAIGVGQKWKGGTSTHILNHHHLIVACRTTARWRRVKKSRFRISRSQGGRKLGVRCIGLGGNGRHHLSNSWSVTSKFHSFRIGQMMQVVHDLGEMTMEKVSSTEY